MLDTKRCCRCREWKPRSEFGRNKAVPDGQNRQCRECANKASLGWGAANPQRRDEINRQTALRQYGLTVADYDRLVEIQGNRCGICGGDEPGGNAPRGRWHVDHDHDTGRVRGLLCNTCNWHIGVFELIRNDPHLLQRVEQWLDSDVDHRSIKPLFENRKKI